MRVHRGGGGTHRGVENSGEEVDIDGDEAGRTACWLTPLVTVSPKNAVKPGPQIMDHHLRRSSADESESATISFETTVIPAANQRSRTSLAS